MKNQNFITVVLLTSEINSEQF